jgi:succinyl-CoA synthetase alpha subunit
MSIMLGRDTRLVVQGITGRDGSFHTQGMIEYGTKVVAGVSPARPGGKVHGVPVFASVEEAVKKTKANASVIYVPAAFAADAIYEAADAGVELIVCISEGIPVQDMVAAWDYLKRLQAERGGYPRLIGPNCPGAISPGKCKVGIMPGHIHKPGRVGLVSRSGTLTYEVVDQLTRAGIGQSTCIGIGGDPVLGTTFLDALELFEQDEETDAVVLIGEIGGSDEETAAEYIKKKMTKPVVAFVAGQTAPPGKRMGHAGAIVSGGKGTAAEKIAAFEAAGVPVAAIPSEIPSLVEAALSGRPARRKKTAKPKKRATAKKPARKAAARKKAAPKRKKTAARKKAAPKRKKTAATKKAAPRRKKAAARKKAAPRKRAKIKKTARKAKSTRARKASGGKKTVRRRSSTAKRKTAARRRRS